MKSTVKDRMFIISDIHVPYHNRKATATALEYIKHERPKYVTINGDAIDFYGISRYSRDPKRKLETQNELDEFQCFLADVRKAAPDAQIFFVEGNHEERWNKYLRDHASELEGVKGFSLQEVLGLDKQKITFVPSGFVYGSCYVIHGDGLFGGKSGLTATKWMEKYMASVAVGHIHRLAIVHRRAANKQRLFGVECGTLSSFDPGYEMSGFADWQTGFASLTRYTNGLIVPSIYEIVNNDVYVG